MRPTAFPAEHIVEHVRRRNVLTMDQIQQQAGCSRMTAWRALRAQGYYTSYNHNASYYTLADIPAFDAQGLWAFRDIRFSCHGTLTQTLMTWIDHSAAGYQAEELSQLLAVPVAPALSRLHALGRVCREKMGGVFVYVSCQGKPRQAQIQARRAQPPPTPPRVELPDPDRIIAVLVELIQRPQIQPKALATRLRRRGVAVTPRHIQAILTRYDLAGKRGRRTQ